MNSQGTALAGSWSHTCSSYQSRGPDSSPGTLLIGCGTLGPNYPQTQFSYLYDKGLFTGPVNSEIPEAFIFSP